MMTKDGVFLKMMRNIHILLTQTDNGRQEKVLTVPKQREL